MKFKIEVNRTAGTLELRKNGQACRFRINDDSEREAGYAQPEPGVYSILLDGRSYEARVEYAGDMMIVLVDGHRYEVRITDPRRWTGAGSGVGSGGRELVIAPMPGRVVRVLVEEGEVVESGRGLIVVEAMKMQNEMKASRSGRVVSLPVAPGVAVAAGDTLAVIE